MYNRIVSNDYGNTVHVVPGEGGSWLAVRFRSRASAFPTRKAAINYAKRIAAAHQPSHVVLFDEQGRTVPIAEYQLPRYTLSEDEDRSVFGLAVTSMVLDDFVKAGVAVRQELVDKVAADLKRLTAGSRSSPVRSRQRRSA